MSISTLKASISLVSLSVLCSGMIFIQTATVINLAGNGMHFQTEMLSHFVKSTMIFVKCPSHRSKNPSAVKQFTEQNYCQYECI